RLDQSEIRERGREIDSERERESWSGIDFRIELTERFDDRRELASKLSSVQRCPAYTVQIFQLKSKDGHLVPSTPRPILNETIEEGKNEWEQ
ncbi:hypothetical protein C5167_018050, partial [Papaver somniferum]